MAEQGGGMAAVSLKVGGGPVPDRAIRWSLAGHGLLLLLVLVGGLTIPRSPPPSQLAIKATVVDRNSTRPSRPPAPQRKPEPSPAPEPEAKPEAKPAAQPDPRIEERKAEEQKKQREEAAQRKAAALEKQQAEKLKAQQAADKQQKDKQQRQAEQQREEKRQKEEKLAQDKAAAEKAAAEKLQAEKLKAAQAKAEAAQREIARQLEAEEALRLATESGALADYVGMISQKVTRNWIRPAGAPEGLECVVSVTQIPGGQVTGVQIGSCNGDAAVRRSIEAAVLKASPLPLPDNPALFDRSLRFTFKPEQ
jgi:colicin import membrane protein